MGEPSADAGAIEAPSPNHGERRGGARPDMVVLHYTAMPTAEAALDRLRDPAAEVSAHWLIAEDGRLWRLVPEERRAWHAGAAEWAGERDVNSRSIGIELANPGDAPFAAALTDRLDGLLAAILERWAIPPERVVGHACVAPGRKADPGPRFDWRRLARRGLAVWTEAPRRSGAAEAAAFQRAARAFGCPCPETGVWDDATRAVAAALRDRFRPWDRDACSAAGLAQIAALAARWPAPRR